MVRGLGFRGLKVWSVVGDRVVGELGGLRGSGFRSAWPPGMLRGWGSVLGIEVLSVGKARVSGLKVRRLVGDGVVETFEPRHENRWPLPIQPPNPPPPSCNNPSQKGLTCLDKSVDLKNPAKKTEGPSQSTHPNPTPPLLKPCRA